MTLTEQEKPGPNLMLIIFEILLVVIVVATLYARVSKFQEKNVIEQKFLSRDVALLLDIVPTLPGNLAYQYTSKTLDKFSFDFSNGMLKVDDEKYYYAKDTTLSYDELRTIEKKPKIYFYKSGKRIGVKEDLQLFNPFELVCRPEKEPLGKIIVDIVGKEQFLENIALFLRQRIGAETVSSPEKIDEEVKKADTVVLISKAEHSAIKIFVSQQSNKRKESERLACLIANELSSKLKESITGAAVVPIDLTLYDPNDQKVKELADDKKGVLIEINSKFTVTTIGNAIEKARERYEQ